MNPPKPTALRILQGNPGKRPLNTNEPQPTPGVPKPPAFLLPLARREWRRIVPELERLGLLTQVDMASLAGFCQSYARWAQAEAVLNREGNSVTTPSGYVQQRPEVAISQKERQMMRAFASDFGLAPSPRGRLSVPGAKDAANPVAEWMAGRGRNSS